MGDPKDLSGLQILGQFQLIKLLGRGGMGEVYLAQQPAMDRLAAVKILPFRGSMEDSEHRFRREARAASRLSHPNIVTVYNFGELADGSLFLAMEYVEGSTLEQVIEQGPLTVAEAVDITRQCAEALFFAHERLVLHRDIKPANLMVTRVSSGWHVKILDFGLAWLGGETDLTATSQGLVMGTPLYMSPEQCRGVKLTGMSDQYALGLVLYEMLTGRPPFEADTAYGLMLCHQNKAPPPPLSSVMSNPQIALIEPIVLRMLEKDPEKRFPDAELCARLSTIGQDAHGRISPSSEVGRRSRRRSSLHPRVVAGRTVALSNLGDAFERVRWTETLRTAGFEVKATADDAVRVVVAADGEAELEAGSAQRAIACIEGPCTSARMLELKRRFDGLLHATPQCTATDLSLVLKWMARPSWTAIDSLQSGEGIPIQLLQIGNSTKSSTYVQSLLDALSQENVGRRAQRFAREVSDEMISNAIFHAPVDEKGAPRFAHVSRAQEIQLEPSEESVLSWFCNDDWVVLSIRDPFGTLTAEQVIESVVRSNADPDTNRAEGSAGMGLHLMARAARRLFFFICPGRSTEIVAMIEARPAPAGEPRRQCLAIVTSAQPVAEQVGRELRLTGTATDTRAHLELTGIIDGTCDLSSIYGRSGSVVVDLTRLAHVNSGGLRVWLEASQRRKEDLVLTLERCSPAVVSQLNMVAFITQGARVRSLLGPYYCTTCEEEVQEEILVSEIIDDAVPARNCPSCRQPLEFEEVADQYFAFLKNKS